MLKKRGHKSSDKTERLQKTKKTKGRKVKSPQSGSRPFKKRLPAMHIQVSETKEGMGSVPSPPASGHSLGTPRTPTHRRKSSLPPTMGVVQKREASEFEELDERMFQSDTFQDLWRIVRIVSAQTSYPAMISQLEKRAALFLQATAVRVCIIKKKFFVIDTHEFPINSGFAGASFAMNQIIAVDKPENDPRFSEIDRAACVGIPNPRFVVCVPLVADRSPECGPEKDTIAIMYAIRRNGKQFTSQDCTKLFRLGEFAGNTMRNAARLAEAQMMFSATLGAQKRGHALLDIAKGLASQTNLEDLISLIVRQGPDLLDCDRCTLFLVDLEKNELIVKRGASHGRSRSLTNWVFGQLSSQALPFDAKGEFRLTVKKGVAGYCVRSGEVVNITDAHEDHRFNPEIDMKTGYRTRSILCSPLKDAEGVTVGVLQAINKNPHFPCFMKEDETLMATFCAQAAVAMKNSQLFKRTETALIQTEAVLEITHELSKHLRIEQLVNTIVSKVQKLLDADRCTLFQVDLEKKELFTNDTMSTGMGPALPIDAQLKTIISFPMERGLAGAVATSGEVINLKDAYDDHRFSQEMDKKTGYRTKSLLCAPIIDRKGATSGVIQVINKRNSAMFTEDDVKMLRAFCSQSSIAMDNSRMFQNTERALNHAMADQRHLQLLLSVTKNLFSDMHLSSTIEQMTMQVHHLLKADNCALYLVDSEANEFHAAKQKGKGAVKRYPFSVGIVGYVARTGQPVRISKAAHKDPRFNSEVDQRAGATTHSCLCCPITAERGKETSVIGVISVRDEKDRGGFEREEENLLKVFCAQAAVAIINSKRFQTMIDQSDVKERDHAAQKYLREDLGMQLAQGDIDSFKYTMADVNLMKSIGSGSYGDVFKAKVRGKIVAVKKLHVQKLKAEQVESFCQEASLMAQLNHRNVVMFIGAVTEPSNLCIITQYCARGSLADLLLDETVEMSFLRKLNFALDSARGMLYLHTSNPVILHRDLKSDNLLVSHDWTIKVADFGLTRFLSEKKIMTQVGTPMWMAPEIIMGKKYTEKADVYAFGIILWEIMTRLEPYEDKEPMQIVVEVVNNNLRPIIPKQYQKNPFLPLMKDCWDQDPEKRPNFHIIVERLEELVEKHSNK